TTGGVFGGVPTGNLVVNTLGGAVTEGGLVTSGPPNSDFYDLRGGEAPQERFWFPTQSGAKQPHTTVSAPAPQRGGLSQLGLFYDKDPTAPFYQNDLPDGSRNLAGFQALSFRVSTVYNAADPRNVPSVPGDFTVALTDGAGDSAAVRAGDLVRVLFHPPVFGEPTPKVVLNTARLPLSAFTAADPAFDLTDVRSIRFTFDQRDRGAYLVSDLAVVDRAAGAPAFVVSAVPAGGALRVTFDQPMQSGTFTGADVLSFTYTAAGLAPAAVPVTGVAAVAGSNGTQFDVAFGARAGGGP